MFKCGLLLLTMYAFPETQSRNSENHKKWVISAPLQVRATRGSCVVVPCSYSIPNILSNFRSYHSLLNIKKYHSVWIKKNNNKDLIVAANWAEKTLEEKYRGRTRVLGRNQDCTWMLWGVRKSDAGMFYFRAELLGYDSFSWSRQPTEVIVIDPQPPEMKVTVSGNKTTAFCFVLHSCPKFPPNLTWNMSGSQSGSYQLSEWQWMIYSHLPFNVEPNANATMTLRCTVTYYGGETRYNTVNYHG